MPGVPLMYIVSRRYQIERLPDGGVRSSPLSFLPFRASNDVVERDLTDLIVFSREQAPA